jgi:hypothetical protein
MTKYLVDVSLAFTMLPKAKPVNNEGADSVHSATGKGRTGGPPFDPERVPLRQEPGGSK